MNIVKGRAIPNYHNLHSIPFGQDSVDPPIMYSMQSPTMRKSNKLYMAYYQAYLGGLIIPGVITIRHL